jgi:hypothetical protein
MLIWQEGVHIRSDPVFGTLKRKGEKTKKMEETSNHKPSDSPSSISNQKEPEKNVVKK